jgi:uncharacterized protein YdhG (YjbR/CyaY superfamily)
MKKIKTVDQYIKSFPKRASIFLSTIRSIIRKNAPRAVEVTSYGMPAYKLNGILVYFAGWKNHVAIYPYPSAMKKFNTELKKYKTSKSTIRFPLDKKLPIKLITDIVKFRVSENLKKDRR